VVGKDDSGSDGGQVRGVAAEAGRSEQFV